MPIQNATFFGFGCYILRVFFAKTTAFAKRIGRNYEETTKKTPLKVGHTNQNKSKQVKIVQKQSKAIKTVQVLKNTCLVYFASISLLVADGWWLVVAVYIFTFYITQFSIQSKKNPFVKEPLK
uniref:hypothetical protein n=1 Tax=Flavobacterium sp. TaxID=239 RepID=UPI00404A84DC